MDAAALQPSADAIVIGNLPTLVQAGQECLFAELDASTFMDNHAGTAGGAVGSTSASLPVQLRCAHVASGSRVGVWFQWTSWRRAELLSVAILRLSDHPVGGTVC